MSNLIQLNKSLKQEIDKILEESKLIEILKRDGDIMIGGSYVYDLMVWKDFDLSLTINNFELENIFEIVKEVGISINPEKLQVNNNINHPREGKPAGIWLGIFVKGWKIDLWLYDKKEAEEGRNILDDTIKLLENVNKEIILEIKELACKSPDYQKRFSSIDIYNAVAKDKVKNIKEFENWLKEKKNIIANFI